MTIQVNVKFLKALAVGIIAGSALGACASSPDYSDVNASRQPDSLAEQYRAQVSRAARRNNAEVVWVNPPDDDDLSRRAGDDES